MSYSELSVWAFLIIIAILLFSMLLCSMLRKIPFLRKSLIPVSVMGGMLLLVISTITYYCTGDYFFNLSLFGGSGGEGKFSGIEILELMTYH